MGGRIEFYRVGRFSELPDPVIMPSGELNMVLGSSCINPPKSRTAFNFFITRFFRFLRLNIIYI